MKIYYNLYYSLLIKMYLSQGISSTFSFRFFRKDKRIKFGDKEYKRCTNLAVLDWNENVDRNFTSITYYEDARRPRCRSGSKHLKPKTYTFFSTIWKEFLDSIYSNK